MSGAMAAASANMGQEEAGEVGLGLEEERWRGGFATARVVSR